MSDTIKFLVQGSSVEPYQVEFVKNQDKLNAYCNCPAGNKGTYCKHRINILNGNSEGIVSNNIEEVQIIRSWLINTELEAILLEYKEAEQIAETAKKKLSSVKKKLSKIMLK